ncbi:MAG TPA: hypothetical protein PKW90_10425, partial [Myxococcota bacterium]|nr:hypothetical protein [Myxococcota bacterium]
ARPARLGGTETPVVPEAPHLPARRAARLRASSGLSADEHHDRVRQWVARIALQLRRSQSELVRRSEWMAARLEHDVLQLGARIDGAAAGAITSINNGAANTITQLTAVANAQKTAIQGQTHVTDAQIAQSRTRAISEMAASVRSGSAAIRAASTELDSQYDTLIAGVRTRLNGVATTGFDPGPALQTPPAPAAAAPAAAPTEVCRVPVTIPDKGTALQAALTTTQPTTPSVEAIRSYTLYQAKNFVPSRVSARQSAMEAGAASRSRGLDGPEVRDRNLLSFLQLLNDGSRALAEQGEASAARSRAETADQQTELERARRIALATIDNGLRLATNQINHAKTELIKSVHQAQHRARKALRTQARSARTGLLTAAPAMADQYREAIHRLHQTTPPGQLLDIRRLGPRLRALEQGAHRQLPQQLQLLTRQAQEGYRGARRAVDEQCKGIREIATSGQESFDSMRSSTSMQFYLESNAIVGRMTAGGADTVREATAHAERTLVRQAPHPDKVKKAVKKWLGDNFSAAFNSLVGDFATTYSRSANSMPRDLGMGGSDGSISVSPPGPERTLLHEVSTAVATELNTQAGALQRAAPSRSTAGAVALTVLSPVGGAYYLYTTRSNGDDAINAISAVPTWGRPGLEQRFFEREGTSLRERLQDRLLSGKWAIARALLDGRNSDAADLALRNEVHWYGVNETTRNNILRSLSSSERTALTTNDPARWATTQKILSDNMSAEQLAITTSYVDRGRDAI